MWRTWARNETYKELRPRPLLQPVQAWLRKYQDSTLVAMTRAVVSRGQITQATLHAWGQATCKACGEAAGTDGHRLYECPVFMDRRLACTSGTWQHVAAEDARVGRRTLLWTRGLVADPAGDWTFQKPADEATYQSGGPDWTGYYTGEVCTSGFKLCTSIWALCGWAAVQGHEAKAWM